MIQDSMSTSGMTQNGMTQNGMTQNGMTQNGMTQNGLWQDAFWQQNPAVLQVLRNNPYARELLKYTYECAMPKGQLTTIDPGGVNLVLRGGIGLAPQWGEEGGVCDKSCQRWVTACLLARTNAYGESVEISMRAPDDAPEPIKTALALAPGEADEYELFEGAFYGNLFEQTPRNGVEIMTPRFYACSGKGSSTPELTRRFNASEGAGGLIEVVGPCLGQEPYPQSACEGSGTGQGAAVKKCYPNTSPKRQADGLYTEVITVYLKKPRASCGNSVCEPGESSGGQACPSDCPAGWATSFPAVLTQGSASATQDHRLTIASWARISALGPDNSVVIAGVTPAAVKFGPEPLPPVESGGTAVGVIAKFGPGGEHRWSRRFDADGRASQVAVAIDPSPGGRISVVLNERRHKYESHIRVVSFDPAGGDQVWSAAFGEAASTSSVSANALAVASNGDLFIAATLVGSMTFGSNMLEAEPNSPREFVLKLSPDGTPAWAARFDGTSKPSLGARAIKVDASGGAIVALRHGGGGALWKLTPDGATQWSKKGIFGGVAFDPGVGGDVYATGAIEQLPGGDGYDFPLPSGAQNGDFFVVRYNKESGQASAPKVVGSFCSDPLSPCAYRWFTGREIAFADTGELLVGVRGGSRATIDLGGGPFRAYATDDLFVAAFRKADLESLWAKHLPMALDGTLRGMHFGGSGDQRRVVVSGTFSGSMIVNGRPLATPASEQRSVGSTFLASFSVPPPADQAPPVIVEGSSPEEPAYAAVEATSAEGARVFFAPPLSTDEGGAGVSVTCTPPPNAIFPIGVTTVECVSADPVGNHTSKTFDVKVVDGGPVFAGTPEPIVKEPSGEGDTPVSFENPRAIDLVDGDATVSCTPASGSAFPLGTTQITCVAEDSRGTTATVSFPVHVRKGGKTCGNGVLDPGEECDDGDADDNDGCTTACVRVNLPPTCTGVFASPADILASTGQNFVPITIMGLSDPDGDPLTIEAKSIRQDERVSPLWCPSGDCADATLAPLEVRAERDTWYPTDPQPDGRVYHIVFSARDPQGATCLGKVTVCVRRRHDVLGCGDQGDLYDSLVPSPLP
ncbi:MAG TPA: HYR domain-containing protein [Polyangiaceae bacterium]|nr:HYR domain-containing protein [Polyangiaceae bacterium]